jgi:DNA topoisomerase-3
MRLVLAEKPSVALDLARVMDPGATRREGYLEGRRYAWTWALGHLVELAPPEHYRPALAGRWTLQALPVIPDRWDLRPREGRQAQLRVVQRLLRQAEEVVVATDAGREGELIWAQIRDLCGYRGRVRRLWLSETTPEAVRAAFAALREPPAALEAAARARACADWLVGMNATMALSARHGGLWSAGRVQTPTLALLCTREAEIRAFRPTPYWVVLATFVTDAGARYAGRWLRGDTDRLPSAAEAQAVADKVRGRIGTVTHVERRRTQEAPPRLFHLTDLQRAANARYGMTAAATLKAAQALYEEHKLLTYPRTDSRHVSRDTFRTFPARLRAVAALGGDLGPLAERLARALPDPGRRVVDDGRVTDHHALLPTDRTPDLAALGREERAVYELVARRFLAALLPPAEWEETSVVTEVAGETFRSRSRTLAVPGWCAAEPPESRQEPRRRAERDRPGSEPTPDADGAPDGPEDAEDPPAGDLSALREGLPARCTGARAEQRETKPPARYTEATLLRAMEHAGRLVDDETLAEALKEHGLGTPATRAQIIETLLERGYIERKGRALAPTPKGEALVRLAPEPLRSVETTGEWERRLRRIEAGEEQAGAFLRDIADLTCTIVQAVAGQEPARAGTAGRTVIGRCPRCGGDVIEGRKGFGCSRWREADGGCRFVIWKQVAGKSLTAKQAQELLERGETARPLRGFRSKAGRTFEARLRLDRETGKVTFVFDRPATPTGGRARAASGTRRTRRGSVQGQPFPLDTDATLKPERDAPCSTS